MRVFSGVERRQYEEGEEGGRRGGEGEGEMW